MSNLFFVLSFLIMLSACSNKDLYQVGQDYQKSKCINNAQTEIQHRECVNADRKTHQDYEKERQAVITN